MKKSYQFRIYPKEKQEVKMVRTLDTCRHLYNSALAERKKQAISNSVSRMLQVFPWGYPEWISYEDQQNALPDAKTGYQKEVYSQVSHERLSQSPRSRATGHVP